MSQTTKPTIVLGASPNPSRYAYLAVKKLQHYKHPVYPVGKKKGKIDQIEIINHFEIHPDIHTITLYLNADNQKVHYDYILNTKPKRIIFNPGAENPELEALANIQGIETEEACTLVMLSSGQY